MVVRWEWAKLVNGIDGGNCVGWCDDCGAMVPVVVMMVTVSAVV